MKELEKVMDKFCLLSSSIVRNIIVTFQAESKGKGRIDQILEMKRHAKIKFIHDSVFSSQGQEKVYLFKMLVDGSGSEVELDGYNPVETSKIALSCLIT